MSKCIRCGIESYSAKICYSCMDNWGEMRDIVFSTLQSIHGKMNPSNHKLFIKETKRLEKIWSTEIKKLTEVNK